MVMPMSNAPLVTVVGGSGFLGRYVAQAMARRGWLVRVGCRRPNDAPFVMTYGTPGQVMPVQCNIRDEFSTRAAIRGSQAVVNCVGVLLGQEHFWRGAGRRGGARRAHRRRGGSRAAGPRLGHRRGRGQPRRVRADEGGRREGGPGCLPGGRDPAPLYHLRRRGRVLQPLRDDRDAEPGRPRDRRLDAVPAGLGRRRRQRRGEGGDGGGAGRRLRARRPDRLHLPRAHGDDAACDPAAAADRRPSRSPACWRG